MSKWLVQRIKEDFPHHKIMGEESYTEEVFEPNDFIWIIDPIDGTTNYVYQKQSFAISIALYQNGQGICGAVYNPSTYELFWAERGSGAYLNNTRLLMNSTSAALTNSLISTYIRYDREEKKLGFERFAHHIANESTYLSVSSILAASKELHQEILNISRTILYT